jgi:hypothetical protein
MYYILYRAYTQIDRSSASSWKDKKLSKGERRRKNGASFFSGRRRKNLWWSRRKKFSDVFSRPRWERAPQMVSPFFSLSFLLLLISKTSIPFSRLGLFFSGASGGHFFFCLFLSEIFHRKVEIISFSSRKSLNRKYATDCWRMAYGQKKAQKYNQTRIWFTENNRWPAAADCFHLHWLRGFLSPLKMSLTCVLVM